MDNRTLTRKCIPLARLTGGLVCCLALYAGLALAGETDRISFGPTAVSTADRAGLSPGAELSGKSLEVGRPSDSSARVDNAIEPSPEKMLGQMLLLGFRGSGEDDPVFAEDFRKFREFVAAGKVGGAILFNRDQSSGTERNIHSPEQVRRLCASLQSAAPRPLFISIDQEGGRVRRLLPGQGFMDLPSPEEMGKMEDARVRELAQALGEELRELGINLDFAPALDLNLNPQNPVIGRLGRSFGREAAVAIRKGKAFMQGLTAAGVLGCYKHFPGHGSSRSDSHLEFTDISATWKEVELEPYRRLLDEDGPYMVMLGHLFHRGYDREYPASLSRNIAGGLLRGELGWQGVIISDDLQMRAIADHYSLEETIRLALNAGNDILLFGNNLSYDAELPERAYRALLKLYHDGELGRERIEESYRRIMRLKERLPHAGGMPAAKD